MTRTESIYYGRRSNLSEANITYSELQKVYVEKHLGLAGVSYKGTRSYLDPMGNWGSYVMGEHRQVHRHATVFKRHRGYLPRNS